MTKEEAIENLKWLLECSYVDEFENAENEAIKMAIKVLEQEPCGDLISREELLKAIDTWDKFGVDDTNSLFRLDNLSLPHYVPYIHYDDVIKCIKGMPSVKSQPKTGHCEECKHFRKLPYHAGKLGRCIQHTGFCPKSDWYCADYESQKRGDKE